MQVGKGLSMAEDSGEVLARMRGFAGRTELYADRVRMVRDGMAAAMAEILGSFRAEAETVVRLDQVAAFEVYRPLLLPPLVVLHYPGSRPLSGRYWRNAFAENVHMGGFLDQRDIDRFSAVLESMLPPPDGPEGGDRLAKASVAETTPAGDGRPDAASE